MNHSMSIALALLLLFFIGPGASLGGEKAQFLTPALTPNVNHRHDVCERYQIFQNKSAGERDLRHALEGMHLNVVVGTYEGGYFNYNDETGIDPDYPGLVAIMMDELAQRGGFSWRDSFGIYEELLNPTTTWDDMLYWGMETYDLVVDWYEHNTWRMNNGVTFIEWMDQSMVLIEIDPQMEGSDYVNIWNWLKPYNYQVWLMTIFTILVSGLVCQILEWFADERNDRSIWEWWLENAYLSSLNFTQAYEYQPKTFPSRLFGVSMAIWALVMTATYTANLASLLVDKRPPPLGPQTLAEIEVFGDSVCVWKGTSTERLLHKDFPSARVIPKRTQKDVYEGLRHGDCEYLLDHFVNWNKVKNMQSFNPQCNLHAVGGERVVRRHVAGMATKADIGNMCTGFIREVLNLHMIEMTADGFMEDAWRREYKRTQTIDCSASRPGQASANETEGPDKASRRRHLYQWKGKGHSPERMNRNHQPNYHRDLKSSAGATGGAVAIASAANGGDEEGRRLTPAQMIGTFAFHWTLMAFALFIACANALYIKVIHQRAQHTIARSCKRAYRTAEMLEESPAKGRMEWESTCTKHQDGEMHDVKFMLMTILEEIRSQKQQRHQSSHGQQDPKLEKLLQSLLPLGSSVTINSLGQTVIPSSENHDIET